MQDEYSQLLFESSATERRDNAFIPEEYWTLDALFQIKGEKKPLVAKYYGTTEGKAAISSEEELNKILKDLKDADFRGNRC